jgi:hypothetical protein
VRTGGGRQQPQRAAAAVPRSLVEGDSRLVELCLQLLDLGLYPFDLALHRLDLRLDTRDLRFGNLDLLGRVGELAVERGDLHFEVLPLGRGLLELRDRCDLVGRRVLDGARELVAPRLRVR